MGAFSILARDGAARSGELRTAHGMVRTPAFMAVGTHATVKALHPDEVRACGIDVVLCNAYHLALRPGAEVIARAGGLHAFMGWDGAILSDSGGYQLVSLGAISSVDDDAATFVSPYDGSRLRVTPEAAVDLQRRLGSDIAMCLDQPIAWERADAAAVREATRRTQRWAERCRAVPVGDGSLLFGIAQGGFDAGLRRDSAAAIAALDFDGNAVGGLSVGEPRDLMLELAAVSVGALPEDRPRYFMGLGTDSELLAMVELGVDMFDCVVPTRLARHGTALTRDGPLVLTQAAGRDDLRPLEEACACAACSRFSRAYLRHLFKAQEILAHRLLSIHNLTHVAGLMAEARRAIAAGDLGALRRRVEARLAAAGDAARPSLAGAAPARR